MVVLSASIALLTLSALLFGCSMHNAKTWQWNPFERPETAHRLPTVEMDFSPNAVPARTVPRSLPTPPAVASRGHDRRWSGGPNARPWKYIVIHHSATDSGSAALFHRQHLQRGWDELGYHFVIDNGHGGPDGRVEIGPRWRKQKHGAHCGGTPGNEYNEVGIGICLVGNFQNRMPTSRQMDALEELVAYLATTYDIPPDRIIAHRDAPGANTECCGRALYRHLNVALRPNLRGDAYARR
jgi:hypothetical protein